MGTKTITKQEAARRLGIKPQQVIKHCKALRIRPDRQPIRTPSRGVQYKTVLTEEQFEKVRERHDRVGRRPGK
jgi:predicted transcriptional regulator